MTKAKPINNSERLKEILTTDDLARYWKKVNKTDTCWLWTGSLSGAGYGMLRVKNQNIPAHRIAYYLAYKKLKGECIDHLCNVRNCVNPKHLKDTTQRENLLRANTVSGVNSRKTHCNSGHEFTVENSYIWVRDDGKATSRMCKECNRLRMAAKRGKYSKATREHFLKEALEMINGVPKLILKGKFEDDMGLFGDYVEVAELRNKFNDKYKED